MLVKRDDVMATLRQSPLHSVKWAVEASDTSCDKIERLTLVVAGAKSCPKLLSKWKKVFVMEEHGRFFVTGPRNPVLLLSNLQRRCSVVDQWTIFEASFLLGARHFPGTGGCALNWLGGVFWIFRDLTDRAQLLASEREDSEVAANCSSSGTSFCRAWVCT